VLSRQEDFFCPIDYLDIYIFRQATAEGPQRPGFAGAPIRWEDGPRAVLRPSTRGAALESGTRPSARGRAWTTSPVQSNRDGGPFVEDGSQDLVEW